MKKIIFCLASFTFLLTMGCYKTVDTMNSSTDLVMSFPARVDYNTVSSGLDYWNKGVLNFSDMGKASEKVKLSLNLPKAHSKSIDVTLGPDASAVDSYNADPLFGTQYALMPQEYYAISSNLVTIEPGTTDATFEVEFYPAKMDISQTGYLLPLSITNASGVKVHQSMKTVYFHIEKDPFPPLGRDNWTVVDFNSQEENGEGPNNGRVVHLFDGNPNTFWHTQWQGGQPGPPHWFIVDMHESHSLNGFLILDRQGVGQEGRPKDVIFEVSADGNSWTTAAQLTLANDNSKKQKITFDNPTASIRYFRFTVNNTYGGTYYTNAAEFQVF